MLAAVSEVSDQTGSWWVFALAVVAFVVVFWICIRLTNQAKRAPRQIAHERGWSYLERDDSVLAGFDGWPFAVGSDRSARDVVRGTHRGRSVTSFVYRFRSKYVGGVVGLVKSALTSTNEPRDGRPDLFRGFEHLYRNGASSNTVSVSRGTTRICIVTAEMPAALPGFLVRFQMPADLVLPGLRHGDLDPGDKYFNDAYLVRAHHPQLASDLLTPENQRLLLSFSPYAKGPHRVGGVWSLHDDPASDFAMWTAGRHLLVATSGWLDEEGYRKAFDLMADFLDNVPPWVWDVASGRGGPPPSAPPGQDAHPPPPPRPPQVRPEPRLSPSPISDG